MLYVIFRSLLNAIYAVLFRLEPKGLHNIPSSGAVILASNHISNFDPPTIGVKVERQVLFMAKEELFRIPVFGSLITSFGAFPVKRGGVSKEAIKSAITFLKEGKMLAIFPEGSRSNTGAAKKGAAMIALRGGGLIVPVAIVGSYKPFRKMYVCYGEPIDLAARMEGFEGDQLERATEIIMEGIHKTAKQQG
jgi:1-acyl-sn-glycerol-3-phosphate acyltransferase